MQNNDTKEAKRFLGTGRGPSKVWMFAVKPTTFRIGYQASRPCPHTIVFSSMMALTQQARSVVSWHGPRGRPALSR